MLLSVEMYGKQATECWKPLRTATSGRTEYNVRTVIGRPDEVAPQAHGTNRSEFLTLVRQISGMSAVEHTEGMAIWPIC
jgi:hypothetical protein